MRADKWDVIPVSVSVSVRVSVSGEVRGEVPVRAKSTHVLGGYPFGRSETHMAAGTVVREGVRVRYLEYLVGRRSHHRWGWEAEAEAGRSDGERARPGRLASGLPSGSVGGWCGGERWVAVEAR